jgi:hypothetical protein
MSIPGAAPVQEIQSKRGNVDVKEQRKEEPCRRGGHRPFRRSHCAAQEKRQGLPLGSTAQFVYFSTGSHELTSDETICATWLK